MAERTPFWNLKEKKCGLKKGFQKKRAQTCTEFP
jgi:hypothetical protein